MAAAQITVRQPVVVGVPLDETTPEVVAAAVELSRRLETALVPVHAIAPYAFPTARHTAADAEGARGRIRAALADATAGDAAPPIVEESRATPFLLDVSIRTHAQLLVVGGTRSATVGGWLLGTVADRVIRAATCPVWVARGPLPGPDHPILCPIDLTPHASLGLDLALRMARRFDAPLRVLTVLPRARGQSQASLDDEAAKLDRATSDEMEALLRAHDVRGVRLDVRVIGGDPAGEILEAARLCSLVVVASRAFDLLVPASLGDVASRVVRESSCAVLALRDRDRDATARDLQLARVVGLRNEARSAMEAGELERAEQALRIARTLLPGLAVLEDDLAAVLDKAGRGEEAARHRASAKVLREFHV